MNGAAMRNNMSYERNITDEMKKHFQKRTVRHIDRVRELAEKWGKVLPELIFVSDHDASKFLEPEYTPYVAITWRYRCKRLNEPFLLDLPDSVVTEATFYHVTNNPHHPEYWDPKVTKSSINQANRDAPGKKPVNAQRMPPEAVAEMVLDWKAVSEEKGTDVWEWFKDNVPRRWIFTNDQMRLINRILCVLHRDADVNPYGWCRDHNRICGCESSYEPNWMTKVKSLG